MPELTGQDIAEMRLDKLSPAEMVSVTIKTEEYGSIMVDGYFNNKGFEVECVSAVNMPDESDHEYMISTAYVIDNQEWVRSFIQNNYEDKLVEACL